MAGAAAGSAAEKLGGEYRKDNLLRIAIMKDFLKEGGEEAPAVNEEMALALLQSRENTAQSGGGQ